MWRQSLTKVMRLYQVFYQKVSLYNVQPSTIDRDLHIMLSYTQSRSMRAYVALGGAVCLSPGYKEWMMRIHAQLKKKTGLKLLNQQVPPEASQ